MTALKTEACKKDININQAIEKLESASKENQHLQEQLTDVENALVTLEEEQSNTEKAHQEQVGSLTEQLSSMDVERQQLGEAKSSLEMKLAEYEKEMEAMKQKIKDDDALRRKLHNTIQELKGCIRVVCRVRPAAWQLASQVLLTSFELPIP